MLATTELTAQEPAYTIAKETLDLSVDEYIALTADAWDATPLNVYPDRSGVAAECWQIGPCMFSVIEVAPFIFETKRTHLQNRGALLGLRKILSGFEFGDYADGENRASPGPIHIADPHSVGKSIGTALKIQEVYVPRHLVGLSPSRLARTERVDATSAMGKIVHAEWDLLFLAAQSGITQISQRSLERFLSGFKIALGVPPQREDVRAHARELLFRQIERLIETNLRSTDIDANTILARFGLSRASLYRMFEPFGGIRTYTTQLRASKALLEIWETGAMRGSVAAARERWRFQTGTDFNRTVSRLFGNSPRRLFSTDTPASPDLNAASDFAFNFVDLRWGATAAETAV